MIDFPKIINLGGKPKRLPMHVAVSTGSLKAWCEANKKEMPEAIAMHSEGIDELFNYQLKSQIRVMTINVQDSSPEAMASLRDYFRKLCDDERVNKNQVRIFVIGQWYELDPELSDLFKLAMEKTKLYDNFFLNFCINYDGREELLGATRLIVRKILAGKLAESDLTEQVIKENLYNSYFPPPELIVETGNSYAGTLLWDSKGSVVYFSEKSWPLLGRKDMDEAINFYDNSRGKA